VCVLGTHVSAHTHTLGRSRGFFLNRASRRTFSSSDLVTRPSHVEGTLEKKMAVVVLSEKRRRAAS